MEKTPDSFRFKNPDHPHIIPVLAMRSHENGPRTHIGIRRGDEPTLHFDTRTLENSKIAAGLEGTEATLSGRNHIARKLGEIMESIAESDPGYRFTDADRTAVKAMQRHMEKITPEPESYLIARKLEAIEIISRKLGNPPSPNYQNLDREEQFPQKAKAFYERLSLEQKTLFIDPREPHFPSPGFDQYGNPEMWGRMVESFEERMRLDKKQDQWKRNVERFEKSLTPEQKAEWEQLKKTAEERKLAFEKPDDGIPSAPDVSDPNPSRSPEKEIPTHHLSAPGTPAPQPAPGKTDVSYEMQTRGHYTFQPDVQRAQELMKHLSTVETSSGIDLGKSGPAADGVDGYFGPATHRSVLATEKLLGIVPPTGKISSEFLEKIERTLAERKVNDLGKISEISQPHIIPLTIDYPISDEFKLDLSQFKSPQIVIPLQQESPASFNAMLGKTFGSYPNPEPPGTTTSQEYGSTIPVHNQVFKL